MNEILKVVFQFAVDFIGQLGYLGIALGMAIESACIPLPSELILPFGGYLVSTGRLTFWGAVMAGTIGGTIGSIAAYLIGLVGGRPFIINFGRYFFVSPHDLYKADKWFEKYGEATAFFSRLLPVIRTFISLPCGIAKMNFTKFVLYTLLGSLPWSILLTYAGFKTGENWEQIRPWFHQVDVFIIAGLLVLVILFIFKKRSSIFNKNYF